MSASADPFAHAPAGPEEHRGPRADNQQRADKGDHAKGYDRGVPSTLPCAIHTKPHAVALATLSAA